MKTSIAKLLRISSEAVSESEHDRRHLETVLSSWDPIGKDLADLLFHKNGFFTFESSLLVRPFRQHGNPLGILQWNEPQLWKSYYSLELSSVLFFAEDAFGCQFCVKNDVIQSFDPETGQFEELAATLGDWAQLILQDKEFRTGYPLAHDWQVRNKPLLPGTRLLPKLPFVLGGEYGLENLYVCGDVEGMKSRANIAVQIANIPDGEKISIQITNYPSHDPLP